MTEAGQPLIQIQEMTKVFYTDEIETHALSGVHLSIAKGEYVAMSGPSGCGKSTLLSIIGLLDTPTAGSYSLNGKSVENLDFAERSRIRNQEIGFIFQSFNLIGDLTVYENVELPLTYRQRMPAPSARSGSWKRWNASAWRTACGIIHRNSPAVSSSVSPWRARWRETLHPAGGRTYRKSGFAQRRSRDGTAAEPASRRRDHLHGDARSALCETRPARSASVRRQSGGRRRAEKADGGCACMSGLLQDVRYALRQLRKSPGFTAVAVFSLALGIGANTAIFTLIDELLILKSLPVRDPQTLVAFGQQSAAVQIDGIGPGPLDLFPYEFYKQIEGEHAAFDGVAAYASFPSRLSVRQAGISNSTATQAFGHLVSGNFFSLLGADMVLGRAINPADAATPGANPVAVISYQYWLRELSGDRNVLGKSLIVNGTPFTVIGVANPKFYGVDLDQNSPDMWLPLTMQKPVMLADSLLGPHGLYFLHLMGRRKPGMTVDQMQDWMNLKLRHYMVAREGVDLASARGQVIQQIYVQLLPGGRGVSNLRVEYEEPLRILMGLVAIVLLIACANLANFLLAKAVSREREISTRLALARAARRLSSRCWPSPSCSRYWAGRLACCWHRGALGC